MAKGPITAFGEHFGQQVSDPRYLQNFTQNTFGMAPQDLEMSLQCASALARGTTPTGAAHVSAGALDGENQSGDLRRFGTGRISARRAGDDPQIRPQGVS